MISQDRWGAAGVTVVRHTGAAFGCGKFRFRTPCCNAGWKAKTTRKMGCYNQSGGGNSSTGRAPDCGSDGCGFDSRFPPQNFSWRGSARSLAGLGWTAERRLSLHIRHNPRIRFRTILGSASWAMGVFLALVVDPHNRAGLECARIFLRARSRLAGPVATDRGEADSRVPSDGSGLLRKSRLGGAP